jgi:translation initiation factor 4G
MTIRSARPDDADFIAKTILASQRGHRPRGWFDIALGRSEAECLAFAARIAVAQTVSLWHLSSFLIAEVDGKPAAALCALPVAGSGVAAWRALEEVARAEGLGDAELEAIRRRGAYLRKCWLGGDDDDWLIEHVAVDPAHRGRGLVQALIARAIEAGKAASFSRATIPFLIGNEPAERCYARAGFGLAEEKRDADFEALIGAPGFRRFTRAI